MDTSRMFSKNTCEESAALDLLLLLFVIVEQVNFVLKFEFDYGNPIASVSFKRLYAASAFDAPIVAPLTMHTNFQNQCLASGLGWKEGWKEGCSFGFRTAMVVCIEGDKNRTTQFSLKECAYS